MRCDAKQKNLPPAMPHDQEAVEQTKRDCRNDEQIHRRDAVGMIIEKCFPALGWRPLRLAIYLATLVWPISMPSLRTRALPATEIVQPMSLKRSLITRQHRPILG